MSSLRLATASNVRAFQNLITALSTGDRKWTHAIEKEALEDEIGRFRVWAGNLGALQKGHSSLDYRLRDSPVSSTNTLKLLQELETNVNEAHAVVSGARLPYEEQTPPEPTEDDDDGFFSADSDDENSSNSSDEPRTELSMRFREIVDIIDNLYKLSVRIRTPGLRSRSLKASSYTQKDPETGIDIFDVYAEQDLKHVKELVSFLRQPYVGDSVQEEHDFLIKRLSAAVTLRRRHFKYWKRHRDKLSSAEVADEVQEVKVAAPVDGAAQVHDDGVGKNPTVPVATTLKEAPSQKTGKTLLSGTEATQLHQPLDDIIDNKSVTSYAVTTSSAHTAGLFAPQDTAKEDPGEHIYYRTYSHTVVHTKTVRARTYSFAAAENGLSMKQATARFGDVQSIQTLFPESQLETIAKVGEATAVDMREKCPICYASADAEELDDLQSHIANHLERIATFALPHGSEDDSDGASGIASPGSASSRSLLGSVSEGMADEQTENQDSTLQPDQTESVDVAGPGGDALSAENLQHLPDTSRNTLEIIAERLNSPDSSYHPELAQISNTPLPFEVKDIPTLSSLYRSMQLVQTDQSYAPNDVYNRTISFCSHNLTKLKVDAIVNNAPLTLTQSPAPGTLHHAIIKAGGSFLLQEVMSRGRLKPGNVTWTRGYALPSSFVIHAAAPTFVGEDGLIKFNLLGDCYRNALDMAAELGVKTIAFPCLGTGGGIFPPRQAARTVLQAVRDYLDARSENRLERIVFCTMAAEDRKAYTDFFPVFFPPTHSDIDKARLSTSSPNHALLRFRILEALVQVQKAIKVLGSGLIKYVSVAQEDVTILRLIDAALDSAHEKSHGSGGFTINQDNLDLLSSVLLDLCGRIIEMAQIAKEHTARTYQELRNEADKDMLATHGYSLRQYLIYCGTLMGSLNQALTSERLDPDTIEATLALEGYMREADRPSVRDKPFILDPVSSGGPADERQVLSTTFFHDSIAMSAYNQDSRDQHHPGSSLFIDNLDPIVTESSLFQLFKDKYSSTKSAKIIFDPLSSKLPGYGFVRFGSKEDQQKAVVEMQGVYCGSRPMRIPLARPNDIFDPQDDETSLKDSVSPVSHRQDIVKLHQIPSVARFYQLGAIEAQSTLAPPSASFNDTVCLIKEDITKLEVDVIVNVTDKSFLGMGTLDRTIFRKGGPELQSKLERIGECKMGDVVTTAGYLLPAKHILHVIPPGVFRSDTKTVLRNIYREILLKATYLNAKSVAIPCIGMGPPRDCAALAMEEIRRFLQSKEPGGLEKIVFTVYSSNNESIYRRLLPVYFPPPEGAPANRLEGQSFKRAETLLSKPTSGPSGSQSSLLEQTSQRMSEEEPLATATARVFVTEFDQTTPQPICEDLCIIRVFRDSFTFSRDSYHLESLPLMSFGIKADTKWYYGTGFYDLTISEVQRDNSPPGDKATVHIRFGGQSDEDAMCQALAQAITQAVQEQKDRDKDKENEKGDEKEEDGSDIEDDELRVKPPLLRKNAGELVKPAFRPPSRRSPSSMPGTPTYSKAMQFDEQFLPDASVPPPSQARRRRPTDAGDGKGKERMLERKTKRIENEAGEYISARRGAREPLNDPTHNAARYSRTIFLPSDSSSSGSERSRSNRTAITNKNNEIRLRIDANAPLSLQFNGDMEGRTLRMIPAENGMADLVISGGRETAFPNSDQGAEPANPARKTKGLACINCKKAYLRCDFQHPCGRCMALGKQKTCEYGETRPRFISESDLQFMETQEAVRRGDIASSSAVDVARSVSDTDLRDNQNRYNVRDEPESSTSALGPGSSSGVFDSRASVLPTIEPSIPRISQDSDSENSLFKSRRLRSVSKFQNPEENKEGEADRQGGDPGPFSGGGIRDRIRRLLAGSRAKPRVAAPGVAAGVAAAGATAATAAGRMPDVYSDPKDDRNRQNVSDKREDLPSAPRSGIFSSSSSNLGKNEKKGRGDSLDDLDIRIIAHLTNDLRSRPTSYIGQNINDMAVELNTDTETLLAHLLVLEEKGRVHRTLDGETWVIDA
ncbi:MACRO domain containing protein [Curvularia clavata]|uniref:MACRO domain containing protein n=1 Tax=Curvularia clavata TaxID=95742 RepID=A0A9Q8Z4N6_CURCL|nr:MACRO domain containing protein [Curvularia clavata]